MTPDRIESNEEWPNWLHRAWNKEPRTAGSLYLHYSEPRTLAVGTKMSSQLVPPNGWIIQSGPDNELSVLDDDSFRERYEPAEETF